MSSSISLISAEPSVFARRTEARARSGVSGKRSRFASGGSPWSHHPPFAVKIGAAGKTSGTSVLLPVSAASFVAAATSSAMRRADVTPQRSICFKSASDSAWTWASINPGRIHLPEASSMGVPAGRAASASGVAFPTETILSPEITSRELGRPGAPVPSMSVAPRRARETASTKPLTAKRAASASAFLACHPEEPLHF